MDKSLKRVLSGKVIRNKLTLHTRDTTYLAGLLFKKNCSKAQLLLKNKKTFLKKPDRRRKKHKSIVIDSQSALQVSKLLLFLIK